LKAIVYTKYGSPNVLQLEEVERPVPKDDEVLIRVRASSVNPYEWHFMRGRPYFMRLTGAGILKPKINILGADIAGIVEAVGSKVKQCQPGDEVFGEGSFGGFAEYACVTESKLALKPVNITFEEAAAVPMAALTALQGLRDSGGVQAGQKVLINGAGGGVGTFAVQIAKSFGAEVTAVCSTGKMEMAGNLGADHVIDYTQEDFTKKGQHYDLILDTAAHRSLFDYKSVLGPRGIYVLVGGTGLFLKMAQLAWNSITGKLMGRKTSKKMVFVLAKVDKNDLVFLAALLETGKIKSVIDRHYPLAETPEAIRYLEEGHAQGKVVITV